MTKGRFRNEPAFFIPELNRLKTGCQPEDISNANRLTSRRIQMIMA